MIATRPNPRASCATLVAAGLVVLAALANDATAQDVPLPPGATRAKPGAKATQEKGGLLDLVDPRRSRAEPGAKDDDETARAAANAVLEMTPGMGGDALSGLSEEETDRLPEDLRALLRITQGSDRTAEIDSASRPPHEGTGFPMISTLGVPSWSERPTRDRMGRITGLTDASGNRFSFQYDKDGTFKRMDAEAIGLFNVDRGPGGFAKESVALGRFGTFPAAFGNPTGMDQRFTRNGRVNRLRADPFAGSTVGEMQPGGGRAFTTYDLLGREAYRFDSRGRLLMNQYGPGGQLMGTYDENGRLTLMGGNGARMDSAFTTGGAQVLMTPDGAVLRRADGGLIDTTDPFYGITRQRGLQSLPSIYGNPLRRQEPITPAPPPEPPRR